MQARAIKVNIPSRKSDVCVCVCVCVCVFFFNFVSFFFYSGNSSAYFKQNNLIVRDVLRFQFLSTILTGIRSRQSERKRFGFLKEERNNVVIQRVNIGDPAYRTV